MEKCIIDYFKNNNDPGENNEQRLHEFERNIFGYRIQSLSLSPGTPIYDVPVKAMAGRAAKSAANVMETLNKKVDKSRLIADSKYDGERT